jgi:hypothetical protein
MEKMMTEQVTLPTAEGMRRYPRTEGYFPELPSTELSPDLDKPCTCTPACKSRCGGECGCVACHMQFSVWREERGVQAMRPTEPEHETQLKRYRGEVR